MADTVEEKTFGLPDRHISSVVTERFCGVEMLFQPSFIGKETNGFQKCDAHIRENLHVQSCCPRYVRSGCSTRAK